MSSPAHTMLSDQQFLTKNMTSETDSINLITPQATFLFPRWKESLKGKCFADVEEVKQKIAEALKSIKID